MANISRILFFLTLTTIIILFTVLFVRRIDHYESTWMNAWGNLDSVSGSIVSLTDTTRPIPLAFPTLVSEFQEMNDRIGTMEASVATINVSVSSMEHSVRRMADSVTTMTGSVQFIAQTVPANMGVMTNQMGRMQHQLTPWGMMQNVAP
ncbi:MAG: hypothetical protein U9R74_02030 [Pseudomonadota bacterium]|nr:hypothetical protein [Pseudomonadota bacterium]